MVNAFFKSKGDDSVLICENTKDNFNILYSTYRINSFNVYNDLLIMTTDGHYLTPDVGKYVREKTTLENSRIMSASVCESCYIKDSCRGVHSKLKPHNITKIKNTALKEMADIIHCPRLTTFIGSTTKPTVGKLESLGFSVSSAISVFVMQISEEEIKYANRVKDVYGKNYSLDQLDGLEIPQLSLLVDGKEGYQRNAGNYLGSMRFDDDTVLVNTLKLKIKSLRRAQDKNRREEFKKSECSLCVYTCKKLPWSLKGGRFTRENLVEIGSRNIDSRWMSLFTIMGKDLKIGRSNCMGLIPHKDCETIVIVKKSPPFDIIKDRMPIAEYLEKTGATDPSEIIFSSEEHEASCNWALNLIYGKTYPVNEINFCKDGDGGRLSRNDVLYVSMTRSGNISIGSDTRASSTGGMYGSGSPIGIAERPRFRTDYDYPDYQLGIQGWMRETPGGC